MSEAKHLTLAALEAGLAHICQSPTNAGRLRLIVRRPTIDAREVLQEGELDLVAGLVGDNWPSRGSSRTVDGSSHRDMQITIMNARVIALLAQEKDRWPLAGDQLYVDMDLSNDNLPAGIRLALGAAVVEVTAEPHTGCKKFAARFGQDAMRFISSPEGRKLRLRGINARVVQSGAIRVGDIVRKV